MTTTTREYTIRDLDHVRFCRLPARFACRVGDERVTVTSENGVEIPTSGHWVGDWFSSTFSILLKDGVCYVHTSQDMRIRSVNIHFKEDTFGVDNRSHIDLCMDARFKHLDGHTHSALVIPVRQSYCLEHETDYTQSPLGRLIPLEHEIQTTRESYMFSYSTLQGDA